jgi:hypothetical protein
MTSETLNTSVKPEIPEASRAPLQDLREVVSSAAKAEINIQTSLDASIESGWHGATKRNTKVLQDAALKLIHDKPQLASEVEDVVISDRLGGCTLPPILGKYHIMDVPEKTETFLGFLERDPELAHLIAKRQVAGFHGSRSGTLLSVLKHGLMPSADLKQRNDVLAVAGERTFSSPDGQESTSFADWRAPQSIADYSQNEELQTADSLNESIERLQRALTDHLNDGGSSDDRISLNCVEMVKEMQAQAEFMAANPDSEETKLIEANFPVAYGIDISEMDVASQDPGYLPPSFRGVVDFAPSDVKGEFLVYDTVPMQKLPVVAVPAERINQVKAIAEREGADIYVADLAVITRQKQKDAGFSLA